MARRVGVGLALMLLAAQPAVAAMPGGLWLSICSGHHTYWRYLPASGAPRKPDRDNAPPGACLHVANLRDARGTLARARRTNRA